MSDQQRLLSELMRGLEDGPKEPGGPSRSMGFFGADPGWTPEHEGLPSCASRSPDRPETPLRRKMRESSACPICGPEPDRNGRLRDALPATETVDFVCQRCGRSHFFRHRGKEYAPDPDRPGRSAYKVAAKADPKLNPYRAEESKYSQ